MLFGLEPRCLLDHQDSNRLITKGTNISNGDHRFADITLYLHNENDILTIFISRRLVFEKVDFIFD
jgi:hypothetical protein